MDRKIENSYGMGDSAQNRCNSFFPIDTMDVLKLYYIDKKTQKPPTNVDLPAIMKIEKAQTTAKGPPVQPIKKFVNKSEKAINEKPVVKKTRPDQVKSVKKTVTAVPPVAKEKPHASALTLDQRYEMKAANLHKTVKCRKEHQWTKQLEMEYYDNSEVAEYEEYQLPWRRRIRQKRPTVRVTFGQVIKHSCTVPQLTVVPRQRQRGRRGGRQRSVVCTPIILPPNIDSEVEFPPLK